MEDTFTHPKLGAMLPEDTDWIASEAEVPFARFPIEVCLAGEEGAASPSDETLAAYDWLSSHWPEVFQLIEAQAFEFYEAYRDAVASVPRFASPRALLGTEKVCGVRVWSKSNFTITLRFAWQEAEDRHIITFYVECGQCSTHSVDG
jgi:hypothetical protein